MATIYARSIKTTLCSAGFTSRQWAVDRELELCLVKCMPITTFGKVNISTFVLCWVYPQPCRCAQLFVDKYRRKVTICYVF